MPTIIKETREKRKVLWTEHLLLKRKYEKGKKKNREIKRQLSALKERISFLEEPKIYWDA